MEDAPASAEAKSNSSAIFDLGWLVFFSRTKVDYKQTKKKCVHGSAMDFGFWASVRAENEINKTISNKEFRFMLQLTEKFPNLCTLKELAGKF